MADARPDGYLLGEHGFDASLDVRGGGWHGVMAYAAFTRPVWSWLGAPGQSEDFLGMPVPLPRLPGTAVARTMTTFRAAMPWSAAVHSLQMLGSHDTSRFRTVVGDDAGAHAVGAGLQHTLPGVPGIFAGDEIGLTGSGNEGSRVPFPWDRGRWDRSTLRIYRALAALRRGSPALRRGGFRWAHIGEDVLVYLRESRHERILVQASRAAHAPVRLAAAGLGLPTEAEALLGGPPLRAAAGTVTLPTDGPAFHAWRLP
jgi:alpha-glucosidase